MLGSVTHSIRATGSKHAITPVRKRTVVLNRSTKKDNFKDKYDFVKRISNSEMRQQVIRRFQQLKKTEKPLTPAEMAEVDSIVDANSTKAPYMNF